MTVMTSPADTSLLAEIAREFAGRADAHDRAGSFAHENIDRLRAAGLLTLIAPREFGGAGRGLSSARTIRS